MRSSMTILSIAFAVLLAVGPSQQVLAENSFDGQVNGVEIITQDLGGRALFLFRFTGEINGRRRTGIGIIGFNHEPLPGSTGGEAEILSGDGTVYAGFRSYAISKVSGTITIKPDTPFFLIFPLHFNVQATLRINNDDHRLDGVLRHDTLPFSFAGALQPDP